MRLDDLKSDNNLMYFSIPKKIITVFDHMRYDRSDYDGLNQAQREYVIQKLRPFNPNIKSGRSLYLSKLDLKVVFPKQGVIGASPFDVTKYEKEATNTVFVLTPTQVACYFLTLSDEQLATKLLDELIHKIPVNLKKIKDYARTEFNYRDNFNKHIERLELKQAKTVESYESNRRRHIGGIF